MRRYYQKILSIVILITFSIGQTMPSYGYENLATSIVSNDSIDPYGNHIQIKEDIAGMAKPSAVGKGKSLVSLLAGNLPQHIEKINFDELSLKRQKKIYDRITAAINKAVVSHLIAEENKFIPLKYRKDGRAVEVLSNLIRLKANLKNNLLLYRNSVRTPDDYLLGFSRQETKGFDIELVENLPIELLAQFIYHECVPEYTKPEIVNGKIARVEHKSIYKELQSAVFNKLGEDKVKELGEKLNAFIVKKISEKIKSVINSLIKDQEKIKYASIAEGLGVKEADIKRWKIQNEEIGKIIVEASTGEEYRQKRVKFALTALNKDNIEITPEALAKEMNLKVTTIRGWMTDPLIKEYIKAKKKTAKQLAIRNKEQKIKANIESEVEVKIKDAIKTIFDFPGTNKIWLTTVLNLSGVGRKYTWMARRLLTEASIKRIEETVKRFMSEGRDLKDPKIKFDISDEAKVPYSSNYYLISSAIKQALEGENSEGTGAIGNGPLLGRVMVSNNRKRLPPRLDPQQFDRTRREKLREDLLSAAFRALEIHNNAFDKGVFPSKYVFDPDFNVTEIEKNLNRLIRDLKKDSKEWKYLYLFKDQIQAPENYLLGFRTSRYIGLDVEILETLPYKLLAQYVYHECIPEKDISLPEYDVIDRSDHKRNYSEIQGALFGRDKVDELRVFLRKFINRKLLTIAIERLMDQGKMITIDLIAEELSVKNITVKKWIEEDPEAKVMIDKELAFVYKEKIIDMVEAQVKEKRGITLSLIASRMSITGKKLNEYITADEELKKRIEDAQTRQKAFKSERKIKYILGIPEKEILEKASSYEDLTALSEILTDISEISRKNNIIMPNDLVAVNKSGLNIEEIKNLVSFYPAIMKVISLDKGTGIIDAKLLSDEFREVNTILDEMLLEKINVTRTTVRNRLPKHLRKKEIRKKIFDNPLVVIKFEIIRSLRNIQKEEERKETVNNINSREDFLELVKEKLGLKERDYYFYREKYLGGEDVTFKSLADQYGLGRGVPGPIIKRITARIDRTRLLKAAKNKIENVTLKNTDTLPKDLSEGEVVKEEVKWLNQGSVFKSPEDYDIPIRVEISEEAFEAGLTEKTINRIIKLVSSKKRNLKGVKISGRSLIISLPDGMELKQNGKIFKNIKIKAVTTVEGNPPALESYNDEGNMIKQPVKGIFLDDENRIIPYDVKPHPNGGSYLDEAINEYTQMKKAFDQGIPTSYPIGVGQFLDMEFDGIPLGFVIMGVESRDDSRIGHVLSGMFETAKAIKRGPDQISFGRKLFERFNSYAKMSAKTLRELHKVGIIHSHPHLSNFGQLSVDECGIYDFTNAKSFENISREEFIFQMFNDFRAFYFSTYVLASRGREVNRYNMDISGLGVKSPIESIVEGYFTPEDRQLIGEARLSAAMSPENVISYIVNRLTIDFADKKTLSEYDNDMVRIFEEIGGAQYDRLMAREQKLKDEENPYLLNGGGKIDRDDNEKIKGTLSEIWIKQKSIEFRSYLKQLLSKTPDKTFILAIDTDIGSDQHSQIMQIWRLADKIAALKNTDGELLFPNFRILRGSGSSGALNNAIENAKKDDTKEVNEGNIFIVGKQTNITAKVFDRYKGRSWITGINDSDSGQTGYLPVFESAAMTIMAAMGADIEAIKEFYDEISRQPVSILELEKMIRLRQFIILPKIMKLDTDKELRGIYKLVRRIYTAA